MSDPLLDRQVRRRLAVLRHVEEVSGNVAMSCRYFGISRQLYYVWLRRYRADGLEGLRDRSCRPKLSPRATPTEVVEKILYLRQQYHFGPEKIAMYLRRYHDVTVSKSGVWRILKRLDLNRLPASQRYERHDRRWKRYEKPLPGHRVQIDVKFVQPFPPRPGRGIHRRLKASGLRSRWFGTWRGYRRATRHKRRRGASTGNPLPSWPSRSATPLEQSNDVGSTLPCRRSGEQGREGLPSAWSLLCLDRPPGVAPERAAVCGGGSGGRERVRSSCRWWAVGMAASHRARRRAGDRRGDGGRCLASPGRAGSESGDN